MDDNAPVPPGTPGQSSGSGTPPPLPTPPPPVLPVVQTPGRRSGRGWMVFALILLAVLGVSVLYNLSHFAAAMFSGSASYASGSGPKIEEVLLKDNNAVPRIAVIKIEGIISSEPFGSTGYSLVELVNAQLKRAEHDARVKAVLLKVDSPGGEVLASDEIFRAISDFQAETTKPVIASMGNLAASGGYYVSAPCRWIVANELTLTGSIGVIMSSLNYRGLMDKVGLQPFIYKSGKHKDMLSGARDPQDVSPEERKMVQHLIDEVYTKFKEIVAEGRANAHKANQSEEQEGRALAPDWAEYADGRVFSGAQAYELGFVDELGNFEDAFERAKQLVGVETADLVEYRPYYALADLFRVFGQSESRAVKIDVGVNLPRLRPGQLYFLSSTLAH